MVRNPNVGYYGRYLWLPKAHINVRSVKAGLEFPVMGETGIEYLQLWADKGDHLMVPREFVRRAVYPNLPFKIVKTTPAQYKPVRFRESIVLDKKDPTQTIQRDAFNAFLKADCGTLTLGCGRGKGQPLYEIVQTPTGPTQIGNLSVGSKVLGSDGQATTVTGVFPQGVQDVYEISFSDGTTVLCDDNHLWRVRTVKHGWKVISTKQIRRQTKNAAGLIYAVPYCNPAVFLDQHILLIDPWVLGAYLGDGSSTSNPKLHNPEPDIQQRFCRSLPAADDGKVVPQKDRCDEVRVTGGGLTQALLHYRLKGKRSWEKHIPPEYLRASVQDRWDLLRGLLDTDGYVQGRKVEYVTTSAGLAAGIIELVRSLGGRAIFETKQPAYTYKGEKKPGRTAYRIQITFPAGGAVPVSSVKQLAKWDSTPGQRKYKYIEGIRFVRREPTVCIKVAAKDQCYLTREYTVTHNTVLALKHIAAKKVPALVIMGNTTLIGQWRDRISEHLEVEGGVGHVQGPPDTWDWEGRGIVLASLMSLAVRYQELPPGFSYYFGGIYFDEGHHLSAEVFSRTCPMFHGERYALTATPEREDGLELVYQYHIGPVFFKNLKQDLVPKIFFLAHPVKLNILSSQVKEAISDVTGKLNLPKLRSYLGTLPANNDFIATEIKRAAKTGRKILVLSHSVDQLVTLNGMFPGSGLCIGDIKDIKARLHALRTCQITFGTVDLVREGLDEDTLDTAFLLTPVGSKHVQNGGKNTIQQFMGRILRVRPGKRRPVVTFVDHTYIHKLHQQCSKMKQVLTEWPQDEGGPFEYEVLKTYEETE